MELKVRHPRPFESSFCKKCFREEASSEARQNYHSRAMGVHRASRYFPGETHVSKAISSLLLSLPWRFVESNGM